MTDALQLARQLIAHKDSFHARALSDADNIETAIQAYEREMFVRGKQNAEKTYKGLIGHFNKNGGREFANKFKAYYEAKPQGETLEANESKTRN